MQHMVFIMHLCWLAANTNRANVDAMINTIRCIYSKIPPDDEQLIYSKHVICSLLGNSPASEFYMPTFRNTLSVPSSQTSRCRMTTFYTYLPMKMEHTECPETSAYKIQTPGNYPEENIQHTEHGESLKLRIFETRRGLLKK